ncbi:MAG: hypothetical protein U0930_03440 [Pirellulales bacterium]
MQFSLRLMILLTGWTAVLLLAARSFSALALLVACLSFPLLAAQYVRYFERWTETAIGLFLWTTTVLQLSFLSVGIWFRENYRHESQSTLSTIEWTYVFGALAVGIILGMGLAVFNMFIDLLITGAVRGAPVDRERSPVS